MDGMRSVLLFLLIFIFGCAEIFPILGTPSRPSDPRYLTAPWDQVTPSKTIRQDLTRSYLSPGYYRIEVTLLSRALVEAEEFERGRKALDEEAAIKAKAEIRATFMTNGKTCFLFELKTLAINAGYFKYWTAKIKDSSEQLIPIQFTTTEGVESVPSTIYSEGEPFNFGNWTIGCTDRNIDLTHTFYVFSALTFSGDSPRAELTWIVP